MWLPTWLLGHITHGFEATIAKMICRCEWADCQTSWLRGGKLFCRKRSVAYSGIVHSREAWGFEWTYMIKCVLLTQAVTVTMCIVVKATAKHNTTTNHSMIHETLFRAPVRARATYQPLYHPSAQRTWEPWAWVRWCWLVVHKCTYITNMFIRSLTFQYIYICVCLYMHTCVYIPGCANLYTYIHTHMYIYLPIYLSCFLVFAFFYTKVLCTYVYLEA